MARAAARGTRPAAAPAGRVRVQKLLAERGVASRRQAETLIAAGRVTSRGRPVTIGQSVAPDAPLEVDRKPIGVDVRHRYVMLNKPFGIVSTSNDERGRRTVVSLVQSDERLYAVGRLDADSEGLLLLTNDGAWAERVLHPRFGHPREYEVEVTGAADEKALSTLRRGVLLDEGMAHLRALRLVSRSSAGARLRLVLETGWKRQVRRMCAGVGLQVVRLRRVRIGALRLGTLAPGAWRELTPREVRDLVAAGRPERPARTARPARGGAPGARRRRGPRD
ncbi:MAG TPA: pseudouridine synthase [Candidatus Limnocylindria bacterium]|jgi:23S rRNA pseudouridine2605 synthase